jgi:hypothetical protein
MRRRISFGQKNAPHDSLYYFGATYYFTMSADALGTRVSAVMGVWREATKAARHDPLHKSVAQQPKQLKAGETSNSSGFMRLERLLMALQKHDGLPSTANVERNGSSSLGTYYPFVMLYFRLLTPPFIADGPGVHYRPFSLQDFHARLMLVAHCLTLRRVLPISCCHRTFSNLRWYSKPKKLTAFLCAQYGWECIGIDTLECKVCSGMFTHKPLPSSASATAIVQDSTQAAERLGKSHGKDCPWRVTCSPISFCELHPAPGSSLLRHADAAIATFRSLANSPKLPLFQLDPLFLDDLCSSVSELIILARVGALPRSMGFLSEQLAHLAVPAQHLSSALATAAVPLVLAMTGWAVESNTTHPVASGSHKRLREESEVETGESASGLLRCATCQAGIQLRAIDESRDVGGGEQKRARAYEVEDAVSGAFNAAALRAIDASNRATASAAPKLQVQQETATTMSTPPSKGGASLRASPQTSPLSTSFTHSLAPGADEGSLFGMVHPLLAHRSSCPWGTMQTMQQQRSSIGHSGTLFTKPLRSVTEFGEASLRAVETVASLSAGSSIPTSLASDSATSAAVTKAGWQLYIDALCDSLRE